MGNAQGLLPAVPLLSGSGFGELLGPNFPWGVGFIWLEQIGIILKLPFAVRCERAVPFGGRGRHRAGIQCREQVQVSESSTVLLPAWLYQICVSHKAERRRHAQKAAAEL